MESGRRSKIIAILGPTSSGKSDVAIKLAREFNGEVVSADSRQIYRGMDIGTGKVVHDFTGSSERKVKNEKLQYKSKKLNPYYSEEIAHYMIDIVSPKTEYNVSKFKKDAERAITDILSRGKIPIICGGTGFWIKAIIDDVAFPEVKPNWDLRKNLEKESTEKLFIQLERLDSGRAKTIDPKNKVRLIRAIEICKTLGKVPTQAVSPRPSNLNYDFLQIGLIWPKEKLDERIKIRLNQRFEEGMIEEVERLHSKDGVSWKRLENFGLEYRWISRYLQKKISREEMREKLNYNSIHYAKRQMTWLKKDTRIIWLNKYNEIEELVGNFLKK